MLYIDTNMHTVNTTFIIQHTAQINHITYYVHTCIRSNIGTLIGLSKQ